MRTQMKRIVAMMLVAMMTLTMMPTSVLAETSSSCEGIVHKKSQVDKYVSFSTIALDYGSSGGNYVEDYNNEVCVGATIGVNFFCQKDIPFYLDYIDGEYPSSSPWEPASYTTGDDYSWSRKFTSTSVGSTPPVTINLHVQCNDCGVAEVYSYTPDIAVIECNQKHSSSIKQGEPSYKMIENDSVNHTVVQNYTTTCYLCGKTTNKAEESTSTHVFDDAGMCACGYQETTELAAPTVEILTKNLTTGLSGGGVCLSRITWAKGTVGLEIKAIHNAASGLSQEMDYPEFTCGANTSVEVETTGISWPGTQTIKARAFAYDQNGQKIYSEWASASTTITGECQHEGQICTKEVAGDYWGLYGIEDVDPYYTLSEDESQHQLHTKCIELCKICCGLLNDNVDVTGAYENHVYENGLCVCGHQEYVDNSIPTIDGLTITPEELALGESIAVSGTVNGNGGTIARVRVSVFYNEALTDGKVYDDYEVNSASFDLSNVGSITAGETLAQDGSVLIPAEGTYWLAVFATNTNGNGQGESPVLKQFIVKNKETPTHKFAAPTWISGDKTVQISGFSAMLGGNEVNLKWNAVEGAPYYQITATFIGSCGDTLDVDDPVSELYEGTITSGDFVCSLGHPGTFYIYIYVCDAEGNRLSDASTPLTITAKGTCSHSTEYYEYARYELDSERGAAALEQMGNVDTSDKYAKIDEMSHTHEVPYILLCQICLKPMKIAYDSFTEEHTYQNGKCACGHEQITDTSIPTIENLMVSPSQAAIGDTLTVSGSVNGNGGTIARVRVSVFYNEALTDGKVYKDFNVNSSAFDLAAVDSIIAGQTLAQDGSVLIPTEGTYWLAVFATNTNGNGQGESPELYKLTITSTAPCDHSGRNYEYILDTSIPVQYVDTGDGANHYLINSYSCICKDCGGFVGTVIDEYLKAATAPHSYDANGVCVCGATTTTPPTGSVQLATPVVSLTGLDSLYEGDTTGVVWNKVPNATLYALYVWNDSNVVDYVEYTVDAKLEYSHTFDKAGTYVIGVYACAPGSTDYLQSEVGSVNVIISEIPSGPALEWNVHMKKDSTSTILLDRTQGDLNPAYTYRVRVYDGDKQIREVDLKSSYHSYNDLKLPRNETYRFEVLECNSNGIAVGYDAGTVKIPLYMKVSNVTVDISGIKFDWDGSYGVDQTLVYVTVDGHKVFSEVYGDVKGEDGDGPGTVNINGNKYAEYVRNGKNATVKIYVQPGRTKFDKSLGATWTGSVSGQKYDVYYKFHVDDDERKSDGVIVVPSGKTNMHVYFGNDPDNLMHPSVNKEYTYEVYGGDTSVLSVTPNGFNIGIVKQGCTTLLIKKDGVIVARAEIAVGDDYIYGFQLGYEKGSDLYYKGTAYTSEAKQAFKNSQMTSEMKQLWFELNLGMYEVPAFEFESYNDDWLYHQGMKMVRYLHNFLYDVTGEIWDLCVDSIVFAGEGYDWIMTSTEMNNHDGLARSDKYAMAQVIVDGWLAEIESGTLEVSDPELLEALNACEITLLGDEPDSVDTIIKVLSDLLSVLGANPSNDELIKLLNEIISGVGDGTSIFMAALDANKDDLIFQIEKYKAEIVKDLLEEKALSEGLDKDIKIAVDDLIANSMNIWLRSALNFANDAGDTITGMMIGGKLTTATFGLSVALQVSYNGLVDTSMELATGKTSDKWREYLTETDNYTGTLEGALKVYLKRTKPQLIDALNVYQNNPTLSNYYALNNSNYSGKLQMWGMQSKQLSRLFYTIHSLSAGDENAYAGNLQRDERTVFTFLFSVTHGLWGLWTENTL